VIRHLPGRPAGHRSGREHSHKGSAWARGRELRLLTVSGPEPGRMVLGRTPGLPGLGRLLAAQDCHSVLIFGPPVIFGQAPRWLPGQRRCIGDGVLDATWATVQWVASAGIGCYRTDAEARPDAAGGADRKPVDHDVGVGPRVRRT
jgi:hypothetical protein